MCERDFDRLMTECLEAVRRFEARWPEVEPCDSLAVDPDRLRGAFEELFARLDGNYPFFHPRYAGQMLKPPHPAAVLAYLTTMRINPNNHALDGGPPTARMEREAVAEMAAMFGWKTHLGHLTSGGTVANLEALWVARELNPGLAVAASRDAHYTHRRMCQVIGVPFVEIDTDPCGRMDLDDLQRKIRSERIGTVVGTPGTTALGALDPIGDLAELCEREGVRLHADAAYGGFFRLLSGRGEHGVAPAPFEALSRCDSLVIDPHKHGLQPYGCGCVLFRDPSVGRFYRHDSPYTYFTSADLHLGEITLECSRPGAAAAALWLTLQLLPLSADSGLGPVLAHCRHAALDLADRIEQGTHFELILAPELDIVVFCPRVTPFSASAVSDASHRLFDLAMNDPDDPIYLSKLRLESAMISAGHPRFDADAEQTVVLRSCLMKPEHDAAVPMLYEALERHAETVSLGIAGESKPSEENNGR